MSSIGVGKTVLLYVLLVLRLQARLPTIYQSRDTHLYYFADDGVYLINLTPSPIATNFKSQFHKSTWCLIDLNQSLDTVPVFIQDLALFIVQASSPRPHRYAWIDKATGPGGAVSINLLLFPLVPRAMSSNQHFRPATFTTNFGTAFLTTSWRQPLASTTSLSKTQTLKVLLVSCWKML